MRKLAALMAIGLTACQGPYLKDGTPNENSPYFEVPVDSKLVLNRELVVPAQQRYLYLQNGKALNFQDVNPYFPYCALELHTKKAQPQPIRPDTFAIHKVSQRHQFSLARADVQVAGRNTAQIRDLDGIDPWQVVATLLELYSETQRDVVLMACASWGLPQNMPYITVAEIRRSLGEIFSLHLAQPGDPPGPRVRRESGRY